MRTIICLAALCLLFACTQKPAPGSIEELHASFGIPQTVDTIIILSQAAHLDWDWQNEFPYNVNMSGPEYVPYFGGETQPADSIFTDADGLLSNKDYYYSVCEMGFLQAFSKNKPAEFQNMVASTRVDIVGGGITSPDNLVCNGECFLRNFLVGKTWLDSVSLDWTGMVWLPDDFGHDAQLPVLLEALDAKGVGFSRVPGAVQQQYNPVPKNQAAANYLLGFGKNTSDDGGVDFNWLADDGSTAFAHWLQVHYDQGDNIDVNNTSTYTSPYDVNYFQKSGFVSCNSNNIDSCAVQHIEDYRTTNGPVSPTPYIYVHVSDDFRLPKTDLVAYAAAYNAKHFPNRYAHVGTFAQYGQLVKAYLKKNGQSLKTRQFYPNAARNVYQFQPSPYWMGYYASRPILKIKHNQATRAMQTAEILQQIRNNVLGASGSDLQQQARSYAKAWATLVPSTHHDYITGTAMDSVYINEQIPLLDQSIAQAGQLIGSSMAALAQNMNPSSDNVLVFNPTSTENKSVVRVTTSSGVRQVYVDVPPLSYARFGYGGASNPPPPATVTYNPSSQTYTLANQYLTATIDSKGNLTSVVDLYTGRDIFNGQANDLIFFNDYGGIYRYGYEQGLSFTKATPSYTVEKISSVNSTDQIKEIHVTKSFTLGGTPLTYDIVYSLYPGEPQLRCATTGQLPDNYTAMVQFPLNTSGQSVDSIEYGTPYHWETKVTDTYGLNTTFNAIFQATHNFMIPQSGGIRFAAFYHEGMPAWTAKGNVVYGTILRNTPANSSFGAYGHDAGRHTQRYAIRVPSGLSGPETGQPLAEAQRFNTPMRIILIGSGSQGNAPNAYTLAKTTSGSALITTAKVGTADSSTFILRLYQPTNGNESVTIDLPSSFSSATFVSALETPITAIPGSLYLSGNTLKVTIDRALATIALKK